MAAHSNNTTEFVSLTFAQQASSINAMLNNIQVAIEHHVKNSPQQQETSNKCLSQVERLLNRLRVKLSTE